MAKQLLSSASFPHYTSSSHPSVSQKQALIHGVHLSVPMQGWQELMSPYESRARLH